jgi:hypothetical protein
LKRLRAGDDVGAAVGQAGGVAEAGAIDDVGIGCDRGCLLNHIGARINADDLHRAARPRARRESGTAAQVHDEGGPVDPCQQAEQIGQRGRWRRSVPVVKIGESAETPDGGRKVGIHRACLDQDCSSTTLPSGSFT